MKVLVGIPVHKLPGSTRKCLDSLLDTPATVLVVDNAADEGCKSLIGEYGSRISTVVHKENTYCNGGWNSIMKFGLDGDFDIIALGTSDVVLYPGWYDLLYNRAREFSEEVWLPTLGTPASVLDYKEADHLPNPCATAGFFTFYPRKAIELVYPIPSALRHWFGDEYIFNALQNIGWKVTVLKNMRASHEWSSVTAVTPSAYEVIGQDQIAWKEMHK